MKLSILLAIFSGVLVLACSSASSVPAQEPSLDKTFEGALGKKGIESTSTPQPDGGSTMNENEDEAVFDSYYFRNSGEPDRLVKLKYPLALTIKDPEDLRDLVTGKGPDGPIRDEPDLEPDLEPKAKKTPWINRSDGDSSRIVPKQVRKTSPERDDITIRGRLFYNDLRLEGRFNERRDPNGNPGLGISSLIPGIDKTCYKARDCNLLGQENLLAARKVVADFWEVDRDYDQKDRTDCDDFKYLGASTVGKYGDYSLTLSRLIDDCPDGNTGAEIAVRFRLQFCNSDMYCFELGRKNEEGQKVYTKYHRDAKPWDPLMVNLGETHNLVDEKFGGDLDDRIGKEWAIAANHYASLVDSMHVLHGEAGIPFRFNKYGALVVYMCPSAYRDRLETKKEKDKECFKGRAHGTDVIGLTEPTRTSTGTIWPWGGLVPHEYGHIVDSRTGYEVDCPAWGLTDCHYGREPDDEIPGTPTWWSATSYEYPYAALIEGWGSFVSRVVLESCDEIEENTDGGTVQPDYDGSDHDGNGYVRNVTKLLCDWYDEHRAQDDDAEQLDDKGVDRFPGYGDRFEASLWSIWYNLDNSTSPVQGRDICDYARYYIEERKGSARVGQSDHDYYKERIVNLLYNNGLKCGYEAPEPNTADDRRGPAKNGTVCHAGPSGRKECS